MFSVFYFSPFTKPKKEQHLLSLNWSHCWGSFCQGLPQLIEEKNGLRSLMVNLIWIVSDAKRNAKRIPLVLTNDCHFPFNKVFIHPYVYFSTDAEISIISFCFSCPMEWFIAMYCHHFYAPPVGFHDVPFHQILFGPLPKTLDNCFSALAICTYGGFLPIALSLCGWI